MLEIEPGINAHVLFVRHGESLTNERGLSHLKAAELESDIPLDKNIPLTAQGEIQALQTGEELAEIFLGLLDQNPSLEFKAESSDLARAIQTGQIALTAINKVLPVDKQIVLEDGSYGLREFQMGVIDWAIVSQEGDDELHEVYNTYWHEVPYSKKFATVPYPTPSDGHRELAAKYNLYREEEITGESLPMVRIRFLNYWFEEPTRKAMLSQSNIVRLVFTSSVLIGATLIELGGKTENEAVDILMRTSETIPNGSVTVYSYDRDGAWRLKAIGARAAELSNYISIKKV